MDAEEHEELLAKVLKDPAAVYVNMARGSIAKINHRDLASFYTSAQLREALKMREAKEAEVVA